MDVGNGIIRITPEDIGHLLQLPPHVDVVGAFTIDSNGSPIIAIRVRDIGRNDDVLHEYILAYKSVRHDYVTLHSIDSSPL